MISPSSEFPIPELSVKPYCNTLPWYTFNPRYLLTAVVQLNCAFELPYFALSKIGALSKNGQSRPKNAFIEKVTSLKTLSKTKSYLKVRLIKLSNHIKKTLF